MNKFKEMLTEASILQKAWNNAYRNNGTTEKKNYC